MQRIHIEDHPLSSAWHAKKEDIYPANHPNDLIHDEHHDDDSRSIQNEPHGQQSRSVPGRPYRVIGASASSDSESRSPAASLIQSAARSILDNDAATPSSVVSDRDRESYSCADGNLGNNNTARTRQSKPSLHSLQIETLPALPDEQDRKRFVGCLAAVLASSYDYDENDEGVTPEQYALDPYYYVDMDDDSGDENDNYVHSTPVEASDNTGSSSAGAIEGNRIRTNSQRQQYRHQRSNSASNAGSWRAHLGQNKHADAARRHRQRRYDVLSRLLMSSSELLLLEKGVAKAFLPMLAPVLVPQDKPGNHSSIATEKKTCDEEDEDLKLRYVPRDIDEDDLLRPFLESLSPGSGIRCLSLLLLQYLLTSEVGYDARIRHVMKTLGVIVLVQDMRRDPVERIDVSLQDGPNSLTYEELIARATRKFESLEHSIARRIIRLSVSNAEQQRQVTNSQHRGTGATNSHILNKSKPVITREQLVRGVKIGSAGIVAGTLFAFTGGFAAPGIAAGIAAVTGSGKQQHRSRYQVARVCPRRQESVGKFILIVSTIDEPTPYCSQITYVLLILPHSNTAAAASAAVATLTNTAVVTTIFGVGGGSLAAYKMQRRTQGLTEFEFRKEPKPCVKTNRSEEGRAQHIEAELFSTICFSGWLRDGCDYQRPWGVHPNSPKLTDRLELLERFYSVYSTDHIPKSSKILTCWKGEENKLWHVLREKYGRDPDHLFPLNDGPRVRGSLTLEQEEVLDLLFVELGYNSVAPNAPDPSTQQETPFERMASGWNSRGRHRISKLTIDDDDNCYMNSEFDSKNGPTGGRGLKKQNSSDFEHISKNESFNSQDEENSYKEPEHLATVWDYHATYGGELYTVRWESTLLQCICDCVMDLAMDVVSGATRHLLKQTVLSTLVAAIAWPTYLVNVANMIDGDWTLAVERCDEAGKVLAKTLLFSRAGHRPVTLVGFSFGARIIYACLKELARAQEEWESYQDLKRDIINGDGSDKESNLLGELEVRFDGMREPASIVEDAVLMGLPNHLSLMSWRACRRVVAGRLVNCYSRNDYILSLMFQVKRSSVNLDPTLGTVLKPVCGTYPVPLPGVENIDVSDIVQGHQDYCLVTGAILERVRHGQPLRSSLSADGKLEEAVRQLDC